MGEISGPVLLIIILFAVGAWAVQGINDKIVQPVYHHVVQPVGCGVKKVFTGHGCEKKDE